MVIPTKQIAATIELTLQQEVQKLSGIPKLVTVLLGESTQQMSFVAIKAKLAASLGIKFEFLHFPEIPPYAELLKLVEQKVNEKTTTGIIVQHPFPTQYNAEKLYSLIPAEKEIEGHKPASNFHFPLSLAVFTGLKYVYGGNRTDDSIIVNFKEDKPFFQEVLRNKKIVLVGRGSTGGQPIAKDLALGGIHFIQTHSQTPHAQEEYKTADILITAVGKKVITPEHIKDGVVLLNVGLRKENGKLKGDYDESEIAEKALFFTPTPGGLGPIDVLYLYKNLIDAAKLQL